jgi:hypothetical protein
VRIIQNTQIRCVGRIRRASSAENLRGMTNSYYKETITVQAHESVPTRIPVWNGSYGRQWKQFPESDALSNTVQGV